jgi:hypothetical protein
MGLPAFGASMIEITLNCRAYRNRVERGVPREAKCDKNVFRSLANGALAWREITRGWWNSFLNIPAQPWAKPAGDKAHFAKYYVVFKTREAQ